MHFGFPRPVTKKVLACLQRIYLCSFRWFYSPFCVTYDPFITMVDTLAQLHDGKLTGAKRLDLSCGLTEFPRAIFNLEDSLEILNLTGNALSTLPDDLSRLRHLRILFCSQNQFKELPAVLGSCPNLEMIGFKSNAIEVVPDTAFPASSLRWLILTDNAITILPSSIGDCSRLQKLMLAGNLLEDLPASLSNCSHLELLRISANRFSALPHWLPQMPSLAWLAMSGNPCVPAPETIQTRLPEFSWDQMTLLHKLGEGASGIIHAALLKNGNESDPLPVAIKLFKGEVTSDGWPASELAASMATGSHPNLISPIGRIVGHPHGMNGLIMNLMSPSYQTLAEPPSFASCTRDVYGEHSQFTPQETSHLASGMASAMAHLHEKGLLHGDFYGHNIHWHNDAPPLLGDFGAAAFLDGLAPAEKSALQRLDVHAFGILLEELLSRTPFSDQDQTLQNALLELQSTCSQANTAARPSFTQISDSVRFFA